MRCSRGPEGALTYLKYDYNKAVNKVLIIIVCMVYKPYALFAIIIIDAKLYKHRGP